MTLKLKSAYWIVSYTKGKNPKHISYLTYGESLLDVYQAHIENPKYERTNVVSIVQIEDYKEWN